MADPLGLKSESTCDQFPALRTGLDEMLAPWAGKQGECTLACTFLHVSFCHKEKTA